jgi:hypothetical protein
MSGGIGGIALTWLSRNWITERLKQSIQHEYAQKLENHRAELNTKLQSIIHGRELYHLRTSLFFDHQRTAFAELSSQLAQTKDKWFNIAFDPEAAFEEPVPQEEYIKFKKLFYDHQLFFDSECLLAINLALQAMHDSFPFKETLNGPEEKRECQEPYERLEYVHERMVQVFQEKIGVTSATNAKFELALLALIKTLNENKGKIPELRLEGGMGLSYFGNSADAVTIAKQYIEPFIEKSKELKKYLSDQILFEEDLSVVDNALRIIEEINIQPGVPANPVTARGR